MFDEKDGKNDIKIIKGKMAVKMAIKIKKN
jgi:hypothetical protein